MVPFSRFPDRNHRASLALVARAERPLAHTNEGSFLSPGGARSDGWHHHDRNETSLYVVQGVLRLEFEGFEGHLDAEAGDFVHVPAFTVHRESNPTDLPSVAVIARAGGATPTVNVPAPPGLG